MMEARPNQEGFDKGIRGMKVEGTRELKILAEYCPKSIRTNWRRIVRYRQRDQEIFHVTLIAILESRSDARSTQQKKRMVEVPAEVPADEHIGTSKKVTPSTQSQRRMNPFPLQFLQLANDKNFKDVTLPIDQEVLGLNDKTVRIEKEDLIRILIQDEVTIQHMHLYMMYLYRHCASLGKSDKFGFICPLHIQDIGNEKEIKVNYLQNRLSEDRDCYLAPFVLPNHWQLVILCPKENVIFFLCSTHSEPGEDLKETMNTAMEAYQTMKDKKKSYQPKEPKWIMPKSHRQPKGSNACGYYVMKHMLNIVTLGNTKFSKEMFNIQDPLSDEELKEIRVRWANTFLELTNL
ncbi:uncharacterized protein LOC129290598 isoform X2 [Prosopis cineraria]|uniref:uncharacterized protein LOC129290598 isoform X2 n=1 Tax=Prosopis cineraria TaxID=364024 RepID=UPI0024101E3E|nr:uncharacterized protein LOC129290598 isoform X2 [Prosopis cineraria]XP_054783387.1 uncharacterized protein LOC129290598 isoform X2 [Prosopis cineraria]